MTSQHLQNRPKCDMQLKYAGSKWWKHMWFTLAPCRGLLQVGLVVQHICRQEE